MDNRFTPYTWLIRELRMTPANFVSRMHDMREYGLFPIGVLRDHTLSEDFNKYKLDFVLVFQSEGDMVAGGALL